MFGVDLDEDELLVVVLDVVGVARLLEDEESPVQKLDLMVDLDFSPLKSPGRIFLQCEHGPPGFIINFLLL